MPAAQLLLVLASSAACFATVFFAARWLVPAWDAISARYVRDLVPRMKALDMDDRQIAAYLRVWGVLLLAVLVILGVVLAMLPVALGVAYVIFVAPRFVLDHQIRMRRLVLRDQMVRGSLALANATRAGLTLPQGLEAISSETPQPLGNEFRRIVNEFRAGRPLADSLREAQARLQLESFTTFASAVIVCMERGGRVTAALDRISHGLEELQRLERKMEADTASGRKLALVLGLFPLVFLLGFSLLDPDAMSNLYHTLLGQLVLLGVGVLIYGAVRWCLHILDVDF